MPLWYLRHFKEIGGEHLGDSKNIWQITVGYFQHAGQANTICQKIGCFVKQIQYARLKKSYLKNYLKQ